MTINCDHFGFRTRDRIPSAKFEEFIVQGFVAQFDSVVVLFQDVEFRLKNLKIHCLKNDFRREVFRDFKVSVIETDI